MNNESSSTTLTVPLGAPVEEELAAPLAVVAGLVAGTGRGRGLGRVDIAVTGRNEAWESVPNSSRSIE